MKTRTIQVPAVPGIDLGFRPRSYFGPIPLETQMIARVTGHVRREMLRERLAAGRADYPPELAQSSLDDDYRRIMAAIHPMCMGGEFLPPLAEGELEIARVSLRSVTADQIAIRARPAGRRIAYRIVDEYGGGSGPFACRPASSTRPLTLRQLVGLIESARTTGGVDRGIVWPILEMNLDGGSDPDDLAGFVAVKSEFYPQLGPYYDARIADWFDARRHARDAGDAAADEALARAD